ncbi:trigger factor [Erythrobacteraceae bacterium CFH 75059]|uniref:trigger factor n=1 Tax=Qipengyuania thermophila TaxID=2509361 RepID=UPI001020B981|nr:trigger factor [Qipengyuania thermophila]TCD02026.1 trigger factor [Erythrobacteraceae bacterium CFH 75059]
MQITQTTDAGLKRGYRLTIPAGEIAARVDAELGRIAPQVRMPGFRPGKVPANLVRKMHGEQLHAQALNDTVREAVDALLRDKHLRPAMQPQVQLEDGYENGKDAEVSVDLEVLPEVETPSLEGIRLDRLTVPVSDADVDAALERLAGQNKSYADAPEGHKAGDGDQLVIDFAGSIDGEAFEGGKAEGASLVLGSRTFIPGFEDQLAGVTAGEQRTITVTFPEDYQASHLAGREAQFAVTVHAVKIPGEARLDDDFARQFGLDGIAKLRDIMRAQLEQETAGLTRTQMKRALLDHLAAGHDFAVPEGMVEAEFAQIWRQLEQEVERAEDPAEARKEIEAERDDYRRIAERRVRLGLLLSQIGQANDIQISSQEMNMLIQQAAQQYRAEDRQRFIDYVQSEPMAAAQLRAPLYEDKVVDFLFGKAEITDREVTRAELEAAIEAEEGAPQSKPEAGAAKESKPARKTSAKTKAKDKAADESGDAAAGKEAGRSDDAADGAVDAPAPARKPRTRRKADDAAPAVDAAAKADADDKPKKRAPARKSGGKAASDTPPAKESGSAA